MQDWKKQLAIAITSVSIGVGGGMLMGGGAPLPEGEGLIIEEPIPVIDAFSDVIIPETEIVYESEAEYIAEKEALNTAMIDYDVILSPEDSEKLSEILLYEKGVEYDRALGYLGTRFPEFVVDCVTPPNDELIVAFDLINAEIEADGGWTLEGVTEDTVGELLYTKVMEEVFNVKYGDYLPYKECKPLPIEPVVIDKGVTEEIVL